MFELAEDPLPELAEEAEDADDADPPQELC